MKLKMFVAVLIIGVMVLLSGCLQVAQEIQGPVVENNPPFVSFGALHSPNGVQQHKPYEWDIYGKGFDEDGEIVSWVIEVNGDRFVLGNAEVGPYGEGLGESETITYQFPQAGWYPIRVTATDNDGDSTTFMPVHQTDPTHNGLLYIGN